MPTDLFSTKIAGIDTKTITVAEYLKMFELHRSYVEHEDVLVSQRTTWFIALNSFLFTSMALSYKVLDGENPQIFYSIAFSLLLVVVGIVSSVVTYISVGAAYNSIEAVWENWRIHYSRNFYVSLNETSIFIPAMAGGGRGYSMAVKKYG